MVDWDQFFRLAEVNQITKGHPKHRPSRMKLYCHLKRKILFEIYFKIPGSLHVLNCFLLRQIGSFILIFKSFGGNSVKSGFERGGEGYWV